MNVNDICRLVTIIQSLDASKHNDLVKILTNYLASQLAKENLVSTIKPLKVEGLMPISKCPVCYLDGVQGYVCSRGDCPCKITSGIGVNSVKRTSGIDTY